LLGCVDGGFWFDRFVGDFGFGFEGVCQVGVLGCGEWFVVEAELVEEEGGFGGGVGGFEELGWGSEGTEVGVVDDGVDGGFGEVVGVGSGEVEAGDLEAVEEQAGAAGVEVVGRDAREDFAEGELDGGAVFEGGDVEDGAAAEREVVVGAGSEAAGAVVEVAELLAAQGRAAAAAAFGEDVAALVEVGGHGVPLVVVVGVVGASASATATASAMASATASANTGVHSSAQDDSEKPATAAASARASATATATASATATAKLGNQF
jgi:hypothetical protein